MDMAKFGLVGKLLAGGAMVALLTGGAFAMMASNNVPASNAGQGSNSISGYDVSNVQYTLSSDGSMIDAVDFVLTPQAPGNNPAASAIAVFLDSGGNPLGSVYDCTLTNNGNGTQSAHCTTNATEAGTQAAVQLSVTAAQ
jgi:hypothetical protein